MFHDATKTPKQNKLKNGSTNMFINMGVHDRAKRNSQCLFDPNTLMIVGNKGHQQQHGYYDQNLMYNIDDAS